MFSLRDFFIVVPAVGLWCLMASSHRRPNIQKRVHINRGIARLAGSKTPWVDQRAFATQVGYMSMILWYILAKVSGIVYLTENAFVLSILMGGVTILIFERLLVTKKS